MSVEDLPDVRVPMDKGAEAERLVPGARSLPPTDRKPRQAPAAAVAAAIAASPPAEGATLVHLASSDRRAEEIGRALAGLSPDLEVLVLPPWDCLPYDRASPARDIMGRRMAVMRRLLARPHKRMLVIPPESLVQRLPPTAVIEAVFTIETGQVLDRDALLAFAGAGGYVTDDRIDEPGEIAAFGEVIDVFPADATLPVRIVVGADGAVTELRLYDPITQRTDRVIDSLTLGPASEVVLTEGELTREAGIEHQMPLVYEALTSVFELLPEAEFTRDELFDVRLDETIAQIADAFEAHSLLTSAGDRPVAESKALYLAHEEVAAGLRQWTARPMNLSAVTSVAPMATARNPGRAFCDFVDAQRTTGRRVVIAGLTHELRALGRALTRGLDLRLETVKRWDEVQTLALGAVTGFELDIDAGFIDGAKNLVVIAASDVLGGRLAERGRTGREALVAEPDLRPGDVVLHEDYGIGVLRELQTVDIDGVAHDTLRLEYRGGASVLAPVEDVGRIWRYGAEEATVTVDRLNGDAWPKRRAEVNRHLGQAASHLVELARQRAEAVCEPISPPAGPYARFAARFGYPETPDQAAAIEDVLTDLASGRPMDRLVCGDVGYGKTEVALRAAAAVALAGRQVAICAPTTVLAKQHFQTFQRRFAGTGVKVEQLSRLVAARDAKSVRKALATGEAGIVVGTHALAGDQVAFADLGLMIIDEEHKFGAAVKQTLRDRATGAHLLSLTATPIPRTLQGAMIGIQDVSVIASPPARRRPIRTFLAPFDLASLRTALLREKRRSGQSFVVAPRIEDIEPLRAQLESVAPELSVRVAHGGLPADEVDSVMVGFAEGDGDVLLATNIIESGLDVPRANTMIIWRPDRFGLAQLHQLRGRVGRGRTQGVAYMLYDPNEDLSEATRARLATLEAFDRLGSGLAISARDLDLRGAGELTGDDQAGHMQMVGAGLYHLLLDRAIRAANGEPEGDRDPPSIELGESGTIPMGHVPDAVVRINLYARLARLRTVEEIDDFEDELEDRFGPVPEPLALLLSQARLGALASGAQVRAVVAGPKAVALSIDPRRASDHIRRAKRVAVDSEMKGDRLIVPLASEGRSDRIRLVERVLMGLTQ